MTTLNRFTWHSCWWPGASSEHRAFFELSNVSIVVAIQYTPVRSLEYFGVQNEDRSGGVRSEHSSENDPQKRDERRLSQSTRLSTVSVRTSFFLAPSKAMQD